MKKKLHLRIIYSCMLPLIISAAAFSKPNKIANVTKHEIRKEAILAGGGCEKIDKSREGACSSALANSDIPGCDLGGPSAGHWNLFKAEMETAFKSLNRNDYKVSVLYADDRWEKPSKWNAQNFTSANLFSEIENKITGNKPLNAGDELLIAISSHGDYQDNHQICYTDKDGVEQNFRVEDLKPYFDRLKAKGVKVGFIENTCFSGASIDILKDTGACVVSTANANTKEIGDDVWSYMFGLGLDEGKITSYYNPTNTIKTANANVNGGGLSMSEAFQFGFLNMKEKQFPRESDCDFSINNIKEMLKLNSAHFKGLTSDVYTPENCNANAINNSFKDLTEIVSFEAMMSAQSDLYSLDFDGPKNLADLKNNLNLRSRSFEVQKYQSTNDMLKNMSTLIQNDMRGLLYYVCKEQKSRRKKQGQINNCDEFELFKKQISPVK